MTNLLNAKKSVEQAITHYTYDEVSHAGLHVRNAAMLLRGGEYQHISKWLFVTHEELMSDIYDKGYILQELEEDLQSIRDELLNQSGNFIYPLEGEL